MKEEHEDSGNSKKSKDQVPKAKRITALVHEKGSPFARIPVDGHLGIWPCQGDHFRDWLASLLWKHEGKAAGSEAIGSDRRPHVMVRSSHSTTAWLVGCLIPDMPHPVLVLHGDVERNG
jgi:hypothetical protein